VSEMEELVRRMLEAHNRGAEVLLEAYEVTPVTVEAASA
jgi:hypothetical protein